MAGAAHFSTMDFKSRFWQVRMAPESQQYTTFTVGNLGFYEFTRMPFGLCNAPTTFQHLMQNMLGELNLTYCIIYLDNVIVYGRTEEEHLERLRIVLECFRKFNLKLKPSKCFYFYFFIYLFVTAKVFYNIYTVCKLYKLVKLNVKLNKLILQPLMSMYQIKFAYI